MLDPGEVRRHAERSLAEAGRARQKARKRGLGFLRTGWLLQRHMKRVKRQLDRLGDAEHWAGQVNNLPSGLRSRQTQGGRVRRMRDRHAREIVRPAVRRLHKRTGRLDRAVKKTLDLAAAKERPKTGRRGSRR